VPPLMGESSTTRRISFFLPPSPPTVSPCLAQDSLGSSPFLPFAFLQRLPLPAHERTPPLPPMRACRTSTSGSGLKLLLNQDGGISLPFPPGLLAYRLQLSLFIFAVAFHPFCLHPFFPNPPFYPKYTPWIASERTRGVTTVLPFWTRPPRPPALSRWSFCPPQIFFGLSLHPGRALATPTLQGYC